MKSWNAAKCSTWFKNYADEVGADAYKEKKKTYLYACVGAAYVAFSQGVGYRTEEEFRHFIKVHMELSDNFADDAVAEIMET